MTKQTEALKLALEALDIAQGMLADLRSQHQPKMLSAYTAVKEALAQPEQEPVAWLTDDEREAFERFNETCEDGEGYDVPKTMMRRLAEIGVIHHTSRGIYGITKFGRSLVGYTTPPQRKPLTDEMVVAAARELNKRAAEACNVDEADSWNLYGDEYIEDARAVLEATHGIKE